MACIFIPTLFDLSVRRGSKRWVLAAALWWGLHSAQAQPWLLEGRPTELALQALEILQAAPAEGLQAQDYGTPLLAPAIRAASQGEPLSAPAAALLESALDSAMQRYLSTLHAGRVAPQQIQAQFRVDGPVRMDAADTLRAATALGDLHEALHTARPPVPLYAALRTALAHYRTLAQHPAWNRSLPPLPGRRLEPGQRWSGLELLQQRLIALDDLPANIPLPQQYDAALQAGVRAFQQRHGLLPDGLLGKATLAALAISPAERVRQIELNLERLRWTPLHRAPRIVVVNVPEFVLRAYEWQGEHLAIRLTMNVIVGKALDTRTPLFDEDMRLIEFSPYWNVPPSIAQAELVPRLRRDPGYFERQGFEWVNGSGKAQAGWSEAYLQAVLRGQMRLRQRPGPKNALGDIKFIFPNNHHIYLHHTPTPQLFGRDRRDFSHGCIRVQEPVALAEFVLQDDRTWTAERIRSAMTRGQSSTIRLAAPLPVVITYHTAVVKDGKLHFFADLYGHDRLLDQALQTTAGLPNNTSAIKPPAPPTSAPSEDMAEQAADPYPDTDLTQPAP